MRPVDIDENPPSGYPQAGILAERINLKGVPPSNGQNPYFTPTNPYVLSTAADDYLTLIDAWLANDLELTIVNEDIVKVFTADETQNLTQNSQFNALKFAFQDLNYYTFSRRCLIEEIGAYCSYCEMPLVCRLAIEHVLPKSWFPASRFSWENFLLCCPTCNSIKNDEPNQKIGNTFNNTALATTELRERYAWPNRYWKKYTKEYQPITPYQLKIFTLSSKTNEWGKEIYAESQKKLTESVRMNLATISGNAFRILQSTVKNPEQVGKGEAYGAKIVPTQDHTDTGAAVQRLIDLVQLNRTREQVMTSSSDSRVANRTMTYFRALTMQQALSDLISLDDDNLKPLIQACTAVIYPTAGLAGYWSAWQEAFKSMIGAQSAFQEYFPGTAPIEWTL